MAARYSDRQVFNMLVEGTFWTILRDDPSVGRGLNLAKVRHMDAKVQYHLKYRDMEWVHMMRAEYDRREKARMPVVQAFPRQQKITAAEFRELFVDWMIARGRSTKPTDQFVESWTGALKEFTTAVVKAGFDALRQQTGVTINRDALVAACRAQGKPTAQQEAEAEEPISADEYLQMAEDMDNHAVEYENKGNSQWANAYSLLAAHWRMNATLTEQGKETIRPRFSEMLKKSGAGFRLGRAMPDPDPQDYL